MGHARSMALAALCAAVAVTGCGRRAQPVVLAEPPSPAVVEAPPPPPAPLAQVPEPAPEPAAALTEDELFARKTLAELNAERPLGDVFFELDRAAIGDDMRPVLQKNAEWLRRWSSTRISIEGHCDERGTSEYNLALGERRAASAREYLVSLGIARDRIVVVSKGEEAPFCTESHESCWQQNRRGHFLVTAK